MTTTTRGGNPTRLGAITPAIAEVFARRPIGDSERYRQLIAEADAAERQARIAKQAANRHLAYERRRPARYAEAAYDGLRQDQDPRGLISGWWARGPRSLVIAGPSRAGKTTAAYAIANTVHGGLSWVVASSAADLSADLKPDGRPSTYDNATGCDLLIIDDLGRERITEWWLDQLQRIVEARCANLGRIVITINVEPPTAKATFDEITGRYGNPIAERLLDGGGIVVIDGPPVREVVTSW